MSDKLPYKSVSEAEGPISRIILLLLDGGKAQYRIASEEEADIAVEDVLIMRTMFEAVLRILAERNNESYEESVARLAHMFDEEES